MSRAAVLDFTKQWKHDAVFRARTRANVSGTLSGFDLTDDERRSVVDAALCDHYSDDEILERLHESEDWYRISRP